MKILEEIPNSPILDPGFLRNWVEIPDPPRVWIRWLAIVGVVTILPSFVSRFISLDPDALLVSSIILNLKLFVAFLLMAPIHEFHHFLVLRVSCPHGEIFLVNNQRIGSFTIYSEQEIPRNTLIVCFLFPFFALTIVPLLLVFSGLAENWLFVLAPVLNLFGSIPDVFHSFFLYRMVPPNAKVTNRNGRTFHEKPADATMAGSG